MQENCKSKKWGSDNLRNAKTWREFNEKKGKLKKIEREEGGGNVWSSCGPTFGQYERKIVGEREGGRGAVGSSRYFTPGHPAL